jgi:hypothetical protein
MSSPAGWYPQTDGRQRYWDGELWTEHFAPGVPSVTTGSRTIFCGNCGSKAAESNRFCVACGQGIPSGPESVVVPANAPLGHAATPAAGPWETPEETLIRRLSEYVTWSGIAWIVLGAIQILTLVAAIAGVWNIFAGITRIRTGKAIRARSALVPAAFQGITGLVIIGIINLVLGGVVGVILVGVDFFLRHKVLTNAHLFTVQPVPTATVSPGTPFDTPVD